MHHLDGRTVRSPAEHRAAIAAAGTSTRRVLGWPTGERLQRDDPARFALLANWLWLTTSAGPQLELDPANDNMAPPVYRSDRPNEEELLEAAGRGPRVVTRRAADGRWGQPVRHPAAWSVEGNRVQLGNLVFQDGALVRWGTGKRGAPLRPVEKLSIAARGAAPPSARWRKAVHDVGDGAAPSSNAVAIIHNRGAAELERATELRIAQRAVGPWNCRVLELALSSASALEIAEEFGYRGKHGERRAVQMIRDALDSLGAHLAPEPANDNVPGAAAA